MKKMRLLTYNVMTPVPPPLRMYGQEERLRRIPDALTAALKGKWVDLIVFQELGTESYAQLLYKGMKRQGFIHMSEPLSSARLHKVMQGGVRVMSRHPILRQETYVFSECREEGCLAALGATLVTVEIGSLRTHVVGAHLQAWPEHVEPRRRQLAEVNAWLSGLGIPKEEPVILIGDLNMVWVEAKPTLKEFGWTIVERSEDSLRYTSDPLRNELTGLEDSSRLGCHKQYLRTRQCPCCPREWLDSCAVRVGHLSPEKASVMCFPCKATKPFTMQLTARVSRVEWEDLSDHYPVLAELDFAEGPTEAASGVEPPLAPGRVGSLVRATAWSFFLVFVLYFLVAVTRNKLDVTD